VQGLALLVTFAAIGKGDWPRAAMERAGGKREAPFKQTLRRAQGERSHAFHSIPSSPSP
jgi:hypothetical protein